jgi:response regulator RpfG family c-di-GMP phosphodiesterase
MADVALSQALAYARDLRAVCEVWQERERELKHANTRLRHAHRQSLRYAADLKKTYWRMEKAFLASLHALANALEARDAYTRALARASGLSAPSADTVAQAGRLHDLGKIGVPEGVLRKAGPLSDEEWELMRQHPLTGAQIVAPLEFFTDGMLIVRHHHERFDGSGYPDGLRGSAIPIGARIVAVVDVYDALTSDRAYRRASAHDAVVDRLRQDAGRTLDGELVPLFLDLVRDGSPDRAI